MITRRKRVAIALFAANLLLLGQERASVASAFVCRIPQRLSSRDPTATATAQPPFFQSTRFSAVVKEELLEGEYTLLQRDENPITTLTWFKGDPIPAAKILQEKLGHILDQNRWLAGRIASKNNGKAVLRFDDDSPKSLNPADFFTLVDPRKSPIRRRTQLDRLARDCKELLLSNGPTEPLFRVTVVPCSNSPNTHFALLVALSHVVGDGHTYYKLLSMLCGNDDVEPMIYKRIATTAKQQAAAMGQGNYDFFARPGPAFFLNYLGGLVKARTFGPVNQGFFALVDEQGMQKEKDRAVSTTSEGDDDVDFVSTNDVLTSWFLRTTQSGVGAMAINFRDRLRGHTDSHAGNYESIIVYAPLDYASPSLIRKSLDNFRRTQTINDPLPNFLESLGLSSGLVTNWSSFAKANQIPGCEEEIHIPLYDAVPLVPSGTAVMIIFRSGPKGLGLFMAGSPDALRDIGYSRQFQKKPPFLSTKPLL